MALGAKGRFMINEFTDFIFRGGFIPHGYCFGWSPGLLWTYVASDLSIGLAYYSIPVALTYFAVKRKGARFNWMFIMFSAFIFACGTTHFLAVINIWEPIYWIDAGIKAVTALLSVATAIALWPLVPKALSLPSPSELHQSYNNLEREIIMRKETEETLRASEERYRQLSAELEHRVAERTEQLETANNALQTEIEERKITQIMLQEVNEKVSESLGVLETHTGQLEQLNQMSDLLQTSRDIAESSIVVARYAENLISSAGGAIFVINPERTMVEATATWGSVANDGLVFAPADCWAIRRGRFHPADPLQAELRCPHVKDYPGECVCVPLIGNGETLGVLHLQEYSAPQGSHEHAVLSTMAERTGLTFANLRLRDNLFRQSIRDGLTGLYNRRYLDDAMLLEERRCKRSGLSFSIMMIDLDHFKQVNDVHGHEAGDAVLHKFAEVLRKQTRGGDIACRYGGEEFTVLLPGASLAQSLQRAQRLREAVLAEQFIQSSKVLGSLTVSIGVAEYPASGDNSVEVLQAADRALYQAKHEGRNRVVAAKTAPPEAGEARS
jgi:diguanylate cyclase (GGDEF)-like protein